MVRSSVRTYLFAFLLAALAVGCGDDVEAPDGGGDDIDAGPADAGPPRAIFEIPRTPEAPLYDLPWPNDVRLDEDGTIDVASMPRSTAGGGIAVLEEFVEAIDARQKGYSANGAIYFRFSRVIDHDSLPTSAAASLEDTSSAFVVDVDPDSATVGERHPVVAFARDTASKYWPGPTLALRAYHGVPLRGGRRYAAVVTRRVTPDEGGEFGRDTDFETILADGDDDGIDAETRALYRNALDVVVESGTAEDDILALAVFTTQDVAGELSTFRDWMHEEFDAPTAFDGVWANAGDSGAFTEVTGRYGPSPIFQEGEIPYIDAGGALLLDSSGVPILQAQYESLRFALTVPTSAMPAAGYPIVLYSHGTGGDFRSFVRDGTAQRLAELGIAVMGVDQIHHGERNPTETMPEILFFNLFNPDAARDNNAQSALDVVQQARLVDSLVVPTATLSRGAEPIHFDTSKVWFYGHSQGGLSGPLFLAIDDGVSAAVISAGSAVISYALLEKTEPVNIPELLQSILRLPGGNVEAAFEAESFGFDHPVITILQGWVDAGDPSNFGHLIIEQPRNDWAPKSILATEGLLDTFAPPGAIEAMALSMRLPQLEPVHHANEGWALVGLEPEAMPVMGNVGAGGAATAGLLQYPNDGHFAVRENPEAQMRIRNFFTSLVASGQPGEIR